MHRLIQWLAPSYTTIQSRPKMTSQMSQTRPGQDHKTIPGTFLVESLRGIELFELTIADLRSHFERNHFTSVEYVAHCFTRIQAIDVYLETIMESNPDAVNIAATLDAERARGLVRGPLHGVPILVKDNMATKDKMQTTAGSWALLGSKVPRDAHTVKLLREAGAIIIGHSNMSEWSSVRSSSFSTGYSPRRGQVRNPFDLSKSPFGSSSGSAAAVSANIVPLAFGTETDTSIIGPAAANGVVGIKPTVGLTSRSGVIPISENMDTVGCFARNVLDATHGLTVISGTDEKDPFTLNPSRHEEKDYSNFLSTKESLRGARFGLPMRRCWEMVPAECKELAEKVLQAIREAGGEIINVDFPSIEERISSDGNWNWDHGQPNESEGTVAYVDAFNGINGYIAELSNTSIHNLEDVIAYNKQNSGTEGSSPGHHAAFPSGQDTFHKIIATGGRKEAVYYSALEHIHNQTRQNGIDAALRHESSDGKASYLDALLMCDRRGVGQQYAAQAGYPIIVIPIGLDTNGLPVGLSLHQTAWKEAELIKWASAIEDLWNELNGWRATPAFRNHTAKNIPIDKF